MTNQTSSWQYDPLVTFRVTIFNQFALLKLAEMYILAGISVVSLNTDGCLCLVSEEKREKYDQIGKEWEELSKHTLEETLYSKFIQVSVNDYIAITTDNKIKKKGDFVTDFELHKNKSARIVPIALENYFIHNIPVEETIDCHENIFDFCLGAKSIGQNRLYLMDLNDGSETKLQKINRYYISNSNTRLIKKLPPTGKKPIMKQMDIFGGVDDGTRISEIHSGYNSTIYNRHILNKAIDTYNIDYSYYIDRAQKIIDKIEKK